MTFLYKGDKKFCVPSPQDPNVWGDNETYGAAVLPGPCGRNLRVIFSDGEGWEHVSVSLEIPKKLPNWSEMCFLKNLFWDDEDCVVQYHPPKSEYVNFANALHLWRPTDTHLIPTPPSILVGPIS